jgi:hypothetical protein
MAEFIVSFVHGLALQDEFGEGEILRARDLYIAARTFDQQRPYTGSFHRGCIIRGRLARSERIFEVGGQLPRAKQLGRLGRPDTVAIDGGFDAIVGVGQLQRALLSPPVAICTSG